MSKKGVELSVNFIVLLVLAIVAFGFGIKLAVGMISQAEKVSDRISPNSESALNVLLEKERIASFPSSQNAYRGKQSTFAVGIMNTESDTYFLVNATLKTGFDNNNAALDYDFSKFKFTYINATTIAKGTSQKFPVIVSVPKDAPSGTYIINLYACTNASNCSAANAYDSVEKMYIIVK